VLGSLGARHEEGAEEGGARPHRPPIDLRSNYRNDPHALPLHHRQRTSGPGAMPLLSVSVFGVLVRTLSMVLS
jgi:hypothetical protein